VLTDAHSVRVGDRIVSGQSAVVFSVIGKNQHGLALANDGSGVKNFNFAFLGVLGVLRRLPCAAASCDLCSCQRDRDVHFCADHWADWSLPSARRDSLSLWRRAPIVRSAPPPEAAQEHQMHRKHVANAVTTRTKDPGYFPLRDAVKLRTIPIRMIAAP
jgi:hypothetical protein